MTQARPNLTARRKAVGLSQDALAERVKVDRTTVGRWERGESAPQPWQRPRLARALSVPVAQLDELLLVVDQSPGDLPSATSATPLEDLRQAITATLSSQTVSPAVLDDWEQTVWRYGEATRERPAGLLLADLIADLGEAQQTLARCRSSRALRRMTRVTAQLSGLMCLTLIKLDERTTFRQWARIARLAAVEADDPATHSWVRAQEAYGHYYNSDFSEAIAVARHAQELGQATSGAGTALAAALEARAQAATGCAAETAAALRRAEAALDRLDSDAVNTSAFGYNEAQLRFHEGNAFTHLGDIDDAWAAQERALTLCPAGNYMDRAMTQFDRASCLARGGDFTEAARLAITTLVGLSSSEQEGIITLRAGEIVTAMPASHQVRQPVRELRELVTSMRDAKGN